MTEPLTIQLPGNPKTTFLPLDTLPANHEHRIPFGEKHLLENQPASVRILRQSITGWQFDMWLYRTDCKKQTTLLVNTALGRVFFLYVLGGTFHFRTTDHADAVLRQGNCLAVYVPAGTCTIMLDTGSHTLFGFSLPYGYLVWLRQHHPELAELTERWKTRPEELFALPACKIDKTVWRTFAQIKNCPKRGAELDGALKVYLARLVALYTNRLNEPELSNHERNDRLLQQLESYLRRYYCIPERITGDALMRHFRVSDTHLRRLIQNAYGIRMGEYIQTLRIEAAKELLVTTDLPVHEIATRLGYAYADSFIKLFKKWVAMSPSVYRWRKRGRKFNEK